MQNRFKRPIENMVQVMAYWIAYSCEANAIKFTEAEAVGEMARILQNKLSFPAKIKREVSYKSICPTIKGNQRADLAIYCNNICQCLIEVKLSEDANGGYKSDIRKLSQVKLLAKEIDCYVILLYRKSCGIDAPKKLVSNDGKALRQTLDFQTNKNSCNKIRVRRVANAITNKDAQKMKRVICIEVI